ncbi:hypothetical protein HPG69_004120 [Diceros bicornis minor]|uniref:Large ribosomal subunit protein uL11 C-terminal domain-containing protein n=1 Tax=Diceros bicornis minor TaxID=77932 RepID=A0A7J7E9D0_DICBM|nr:hypothetical protein HPG69_004120 [Diceros bicornis minor]
MIIKDLKESPRNRKKQKNIKHSGNITFDEIVNIAQQMQHRYLSRELSGTIKEIMGTAQSFKIHDAKLSSKQMGQAPVVWLSPSSHELDDKSLTSW